MAGVFTGKCLPFFDLWWSEGEGAGPGLESHEGWVVL